MKSRIPLIVLIIGLAVFSNLLLAQQENNECRKLEEEIRDLIGECQTCVSDEECFLDESFDLSCPFGCHFIRSYTEDDGEYLALIGEKINKYNKECPSCLYRCPVAPEKNEAGCRRNKCVDLRFYER